MSRDKPTRKRPSVEAAPQPARALSSPTPTLGADLVGEAFGDFRILRLLGQGGMGKVYLAEQVSLHRKVAIKVLREEILSNPTALLRFQSESRIVAQLSHANIVQVYMVGEHAGLHYMVLEYVEGKSLHYYLTRKGPLEVPLALSLMRQIATALQRANELGIVHRDIKPENILLTRKAEAKVADFGLSRCLTADEPLNLTRVGSAVGTPLYMSPEQVEGKPVDHRSDLYSFGVTCYHMLTGETPYEGTHGYEIALKHVREDPPPLELLRPQLPPALCTLVRKLMAKNIEARYQSAREVLKDIARVRETISGTTGTLPAATLTTDAILLEDEDTTPVETPSRKRPARKRSARRPWVLPLAIVGGLVLLLGGAALAWRLLSPPSASNAVQPVADGSGKDDNRQTREDALKEGSLRKAVDEHLKEAPPRPNGLQDCIDLGVFYLNHDKVSETEALFKRMDDSSVKSPYHYVGRLGLAVVDVLKKDYPAAHEKLKKLFDPKSSSAATLKEILAKNHELAEWVSWADPQDLRSWQAGATPPRFPTGPNPNWPRRPPPSFMKR